ncbi:hypothetical protein PNOK_0535700 [Pyrrhoderma noxium]|uniref:HAM1-like N-terminal domain-containing protein n=1 Tax=Pyrrhoderma noxium TaxID=2282107 RepID=A0A286UGC0_9AGAM|nr:hypothetical protein PNOK_0535700 [Pyrrhoderma noxium]
MGICTSCLKRTKERIYTSKHPQEERQPLLGSSPTDNDTDADAESQYTKKIADVLGALRAGKLPTTDQLNSAIRVVLGRLRSDLEEEGDDFGLSDSQGSRSNARGIISDRELGGVNERGTKVVGDVRALLEVVGEVGLEKNSDDKIQNLIYTFREFNSPPVKTDGTGEVRVELEGLEHLKTAASAIPSQDEVTNDLAALTSAIQTLTIQIFTTSTLRIILSDLLTGTRQYVADVAKGVKDVAGVVGAMSEEVEEKVRPSPGEGGVEGLNMPELKSGSGLGGGMHAEPSSRMKEIKVEYPSLKVDFIERIEKVFSQAQASPKSNAALRTLLFLIRKYAERVEVVSSAVCDASKDLKEGESRISVVAPLIIPDPKFKQLLEDLKTLLERFAGGKSLDTLLDRLFEFIHHALHPSNVKGEEGEESKGDEIRQYINRIGLWLDDALLDPKFVTSEQGRRTASELYDQGFSILQNQNDLSNDLSRLLDETRSFAGALTNNRSTTKLFRAIDTFQTDTRELVDYLVGICKHDIKHWRSALLRTILGWVIPRVLSAVSTIPMPRVEYVDKKGGGEELEVAVDALLLRAEESLVPDVICVQEFADLRVEVDESVGAFEFVGPNEGRESGSGTRPSNSNRDLEGGGETVGRIQIPAITDYQEPSEGQQQQQHNEADQTQVPSKREHRRRKKRTKTSTSSRIKFHIEGLRLAAKQVGYYISYTHGWKWLGYSDEGLVDIEVGRGTNKRGEGLSLEVELEVDLDSGLGRGGETMWNSISGHQRGSQSQSRDGDGDRDEDRDGDRDKDKKLFKVLNVHSSLPGLHLRLSKSRHYILNSLLLAPLAGPLGRMVGPMVIDTKIRSLLEGVEEKMRNVWVGAERESRKKRGGGEEGLDRGDGEEIDSGIGIGDIWNSLLESFSSSTGGEEGEDENEDEGEDEERETYTESYTNVNLLGITRTSISQPEPDPISRGSDSRGIGNGGESEAEAEVEQPQESVLAIGLGAQLLPGKAEPLKESEPVEQQEQQGSISVPQTAKNILKDMQRDVGQTTSSVLSSTQETVDSGIERAVHTRRSLEEAQNQLTSRMYRESKKRGWRSKVFDI